MIKTPSGQDVSPDHEERIRDFYVRHGGQGSRPESAGVSDEGDAGWFEVQAADGYRLRCEWTKLGDREEMRFMEVAP